MGLCLSICGIGVIMVGEGLGGWKGIRRWTQMDADFSWHAKIFGPFRFFVRNANHCCTSTAKAGEAGW